MDRTDGFESSRVLSRRAVIGGTVALGVSSLTDGQIGASVGVTGRGIASIRRERSIRLAHLTDTHLGPDRHAPMGFASCLAHAQGLDDPVELIVTGGDNIFSAYDTDAGQTQALWDLWSRSLRDHCSVPVEHCIGNRDIWGWDKHKSRTSGAEPRWGKAWALEALGLDRSYRSFSRAGWHFVVLDSIAPTDDAEGFQARLDDEQFEWLRGDLRENRGAPTLIISHAPILSACVYLDGPYEKTGDWVVPRAWMHVDARRLVDLFAENRQVRACLSGHIHQVDGIVYEGVSYFCNGAVCGNWWKGPNLRCDSGYAVVDLYADGSVECRYQTFGWAYRPD